MTNGHALQPGQPKSETWLPDFDGYGAIQTDPQVFTSTVCC